MPGDYRPLSGEVADLGMFGFWAEPSPVRRQQLVSTGILGVRAAPAMSADLRPSPLLNADRVGKRYQGVWALREVSLQVGPAEAWLLTGHNGSGKSTLLQLLSGLMRPTSGAVSFVGKPRPDPLDVGMVSHHSHHYDELSGRENLQLVQRRFDLPADAVTRALDEVGLLARGNDRVRAYSAGMKKRLQLARILLKRPRLVLLDEPFGELDPAGSDWLEGVIKRLVNEGAAVVLATHLIEQGQRLCSHRLHLSAGRVVAADSTTVDEGPR